MNRISMMNRAFRRLVVMAAGAMVLASCATKKIVTTPTDPTVNETKTTDYSAEALQRKKAAFVKKVAATATPAQYITSKIDFTIKMGEKDISVGGKIFMKKDDVIRIQLSVPLLGMEAGRLEFTKDYVLILDRIHTQYIKGDYNQVDFLKNNGLNFNSLQALFWNQLFVPGSLTVTESDLKNFAVDFGSADNANMVSLQRDNMSYQWQADNKTALIGKTQVDYSNKSTNNTQLTCTYADFKQFQGKQFPHDITLDMKSTATKKVRDMSIRLKLKNPNTDSDWETRTTVKDKYKKVSVDDVLGKLMSL